MQGRGIIPPALRQKLPVGFAKKNLPGGWFFARCFFVDDRKAACRGRMRGDGYFPGIWDEKGSEQIRGPALRRNRPTYLSRVCSSWFQSPERSFAV